MTVIPNIFVPAATLRILERLEQAGFETWCVGGAVRDALRGELPSDFDLATAARPEEVRALFKRTIPIGVEHGTLGVLDREGGMHEVTTFRRDVTTDGRHAVVAFGVSLEEDLGRRDFTINAIAWSPLRQELRDPFGGAGDLRDAVVRAVGSADARFREDRLRIVRAIRFAARFKFEIAPETWAAILSQAGHTAHLSAERVREEWLKSLRTTADLERLVQLWIRSGLAEIWLPELLAPQPQPPWNGDLPVDPVILTALLVSRNASVWSRFKGSAQEIRRGELLDRGPAEPGSADAIAVRRWMAQVAGAADDLIEVARWKARLAGSDQPDWTKVAAQVHQRGEATTRSGLAITGADLLREQIVASGPEMGQLLDRLLNEVLEDPSCNSVDQLLQRARELR